MKYFTPAIIISAFSLIVSLTLMAIKIWETYRDRLRIEAWRNTSFEDESISLANPTRNTILIKHWDLIWIKKRFFFPRGKYSVQTNYDGNNSMIKLEPCNFYEIDFNEPFQINWEPGQPNMDLCIDLYVAGRKRPVRKIIMYYSKR